MYHSWLIWAPLAESGQVFGWGNNEYGQLGVPTEEPQVCTPVLIGLPNLDGELISMATGGAFTAFLTSKITLFKKTILAIVICDISQMIHQVQVVSFLLGTV